MISRLLAVAAAVLFPCAAIGADYPISNPKGIDEVFNEPMLDAFYRELGFTFQKEKSRTGDTLYAIQAGAGGPRFGARLTACSDATRTSCYGIDYFALLTTPPDYQSTAFMNGVNLSVPFAKVGILDNGLTVLTRYVISDGGIVRANHLMNIVVFFGQANAMLEGYQGRGGTGVSFPGSAQSAKVGVHSAPGDLGAGGINPDLARAITEATIAGPQWSNNPATMTGRFLLPAIAETAD